jgi:TolB-like protein
MKIWTSELKELEILYSSFKGRFANLGNELERLINASDENMVLVYARRCLEVIVTDLCESELNRPRKTEPLQGIIEKLNREEKIPSHISASMLSLNTLSTFGSHPKEFDPEQIKPVLSNLAIIIRWYLKHKESMKTDEPTLEGTRFESKGQDSVLIQKQKLVRKLKPGKKSIIVVSAILLAGAIAVGALFISKVIGGKGKTGVGKEPEKSIAVMPFHNFTGDPGQEYKCDGLTDEIISHLYKIASFDKVVSFSSVYTYKGTDKRLPQIADELNVNYILEGTYKRIGDQIRITAQLIEPKKDRHLWQHDYDRPYQEIITIPADIALQIADHIKAFITESEKQNIQRIPTTNHEAYDLMQHINDLVYESRSVKDVEQMLNICFKAIDLDPGYADAYAWAGNLTLMKGNFMAGSDMQSVQWDAEKFLEKTIELDPDNPLAHGGLAEFNEWIKWDYISAETEFLKAIEISPGNQIYYWGYVEFLIKRDRPKDALKYALALNKGFGLYLRAEASTILGIESGKIDEARKAINIILDSDSLQNYPWAGWKNMWLGEYDTARSYLEYAVENGDPQMSMPRYKASLALAYYKTKNYQLAQTSVNQLIDQSKKTTAGSPDFFLGWYYSGIGKADSAFFWLEKAYQNRSPEMPWLKVDPGFKNLKNDPRYWDLYERTGHRAYDEYYEKTRKK